MTHRHELVVNDEFPLSYRCRRRRSRSSMPSAGAGPETGDRSRVVGNVLKRFADQNHFGPNFAQFLDSAYHQQNGNEEREATSRSSVNREDRIVDNALGAYRRQKELEAGYEKEGSGEESQHQRPFLVHTDNSDYGSPPSLADDDSKCAVDYLTDDVENEGSIPRQSPSQTLIEDPGNLELPSSGVAARARRSRTRMNSSDTTKGSPTLTSVASVEFDHSIATLVSIFGSPWSAELLGVVLRCCKGNIDGAIDAILAHGDKDPKTLGEKLNIRSDADGGNNGDVRKTERLGLEEENGGDVEHAPRLPVEERQLWKNATPAPSLVGTSVNRENSVPFEILPSQQSDTDEVSLLSFPMAEGSLAGSDGREPTVRDQQHLRRSAPLRSRREGAISRDDSFARLLVSEEWAPKFRVSQVMPMREEVGAHEC
eukprot:CAMPEP_0197437866 /NCGR_PEP_ID=MMETSP1175-20131217/5004_1 /TAXON_ID=1003142 /ORGANISM="Triceratium dubium, Strain CCMP147" /LENGTH=426 /DNA_ID=CAMNT_0042967489 /DNA_START=130 /DNA_END=1410 /DNA_ORIENTATION=-